MKNARSSNPTRLAARLVKEGRLEKLRSGLYYAPEISRFPRHPSIEWFAVDLIEKRALVGVGRADLEPRLAAAIRSGRLDAARLQEMASEFGTRSTQSLVQRVSAQT